GDKPVEALLKSRDAVNSSSACQQNSVTAVVSGVPPEAVRGEDLLESPATLTIIAAGASGGQLFTSIRASAGAATNTCFDINGIGSPLQNQVAVMKIDLDTPSGGADGGELSVVERSSLGACSVRVRTQPGESAAQIAASVVNAFQAPGVPGPLTCPAIQNPRDMTVDGSSIVSVLASELRVCNGDRGVGMFIGPKELPNSRHLALQYAVKVLCGANGGRETQGKSVGTDPRVAPGTYFTAINIHNPGERPVVARMKVAVALPNGHPGPISKFFDFKLAPDQVVSIDCAELYERFGVKPIFTDGFTIIESEAELDVVAVYTAAGATGKVESVETERVPPRLQ
ncbi:MAG TPA: hypothetical protein VFU86_02255, partial [Terriglobales bacterium]|nr:hypothetical protein [Terriglobales bacterium]